MKPWILILCLFLLLCCGGCTAAPTDLPGPVVYIVLGEALNGKALFDVDCQWSSEDFEWIERAGRLWRQVGFDVRPLNEPVDGSLEPPNVLVVLILRDRTAFQTSGRMGYSVRPEGTAYIDASISKYKLMTIVAHELGHLLLDTGKHLPEGQQGLMSTSTSYIHLSEADYAFACDEANRCERFKL